MAAGAAPVLETERLVLRPFRAADGDAQAAMMASPQVMAHLGGPLGGEESWRKLLCGAGLWGLFGYGYWAVELRAERAMIGQVGFADFMRELTPSIRGLPEMGWLFAQEASGQGFATEAALAALTWLDEEIAPSEVPAIIDPGNAASIRVAEKCGFTEREEATYRGAPILLFRRRPRPD
jgi:RimJ/RimL family protein N-acetyltransferase